MTSPAAKSLDLEKVLLAEPIPCSHPAPKPSPLVFDRIVTIFVGKGPDSKEFQVHRGLLCFHSKYFKNLLDGPFKEGSSTSHVMPDVDVETFHMFYTWLYTGTVTDSAGKSDTSLNNGNFIGLYVFADFYMVQELKNRALDLSFLAFRKNWSIGMRHISLTYEQTTDNSPLRKLHVDLLIETSKLKPFATSAHSLPLKFIVDLVEVCRKEQVAPGSAYGLLNRGGKKGWFNAKRDHLCEKYHEHLESEMRPTSDSTYVNTGDVSLVGTSEETGISGL